MFIILIFFSLLLSFNAVANDVADGTNHDFLSDEEVKGLDSLPVQHNTVDDLYLSTGENLGHYLKNHPRKDLQKIKE